MLVFFALLCLSICLVWLLRGARFVSLRNKVVLITGVAENNIGHACAVESVKAGAAKIVLASFRASTAGIVRELHDLNPACDVVELHNCDLCSSGGMDAVLKSGPFDLVVLSHVQSVNSSSLDEKIEHQMLDLFRVNVLSCVGLLRRLVPTLISRNGRVVVISRFLTICCVGSVL